jgi:hypothetical protein
MNTTRVVNIEHSAYDIYIGRAGHGEEGYFGNPYARGKTCSRCGHLHRTPSSTLGCYSDYFYERLQADARFAARVASLKGKVLGCFCRPKRGFSGRLLCHGQIIVAHIEGLEPVEVG